MPSDPYYDRAGNPIGLMEWAKLIEDRNYKRVASTEVGGLWVSTVFLGLDHRFGEGPPLIFETMIFKGTAAEIEDWAEDYAERYSTEAAALTGHDRAVEWAKEHSHG